jgi:hypothetical protein
LGHEHVPVQRGGVVDDGWHAGGEAGARDGEGSGQVAVDRGASGCGSSRRDRGCDDFDV